MFILFLIEMDHLYNAEILRTSMSPNQNFAETERIDHGSPLRLASHSAAGGQMDLEVWPGAQAQVICLSRCVLT